MNASLFCINVGRYWDENSLSDVMREPEEMYKIHQQMIAFVDAWLDDFKKSKKT